MRKANSLRDWLLRSVPDLAAERERLHVYLSEGSIDFSRSEPANLSFGYNYRLDLVIERFSGSLDTLFVPLIIWLSRHEPQVIDKNPKGLRFEVDQLDNQRADITIAIAIKEPVIVSADPDTQGGFLAEHPEQKAFPAVFEGVDASLSQLFLDEFGTTRFLAAASEDDLGEGA